MELINNINLADLVLAAVLLLFVFIGARRGLFKSLTSLIVVIVAIIGAGFLANLVTAPLSDLIYPVVESKFIEMLPSFDKVAESGAELIASVELLKEKLAEFGIDSSAVGGLLEGVDAADMISTAAQTVFHSILQGILIVLFFLLLLLALKLLVNTFNLVFKLPVLNFVNTLGGAIFGFIEGSLLVFLGIFLLQKCGGSLTLHADGGFLLSLFLSNTPRTLLAALLQQVK